MTTFSPTTLAADINLAWDAPVGANVGGYNVYFGLSSRSYSNKVSIGNRTSYTLSGLESGKTYYIAVTAQRGTSSIESNFSNEVSVRIPFPDSDNDGMPDIFEISNTLDPFDPSDANLDADQDGLTNLQEFKTGRNPTLNEGAIFKIINSLLLN